MRNAVFLLEHHNVSIILFLSLLDNLFDWKVFTRPVLKVRDCDSQLFKKFEYFLQWSVKNVTYSFGPAARRHDYLRRRLSVEVFIKFIESLLAEQLLVVRVGDHRLIWHSHFLDCDSLFLRHCFLT